MLKNIAFFSNNKIAKSLQIALNGANRKYNLYFSKDEINIIDLQNRRFLYPKGAFVSVAQNIAQTPLNNDKWRIYANNLRLKKLQKNSDGNYGVANLKATAEAINRIVDIAKKSNLSLGMQSADFADSTHPLHHPSTRDGDKNATAFAKEGESSYVKSNNFPLPCGGGLRGWVESSLQDSRSKSKQSKLGKSMAEKLDSPSLALGRCSEWVDSHINPAYHLPPLFLPQTNIFGLCGGLFLDILLEMGYFFHSLLIYEEEAELFALSCYFVDYELLFSRVSPKSCYIFIENLLDKGLLNHYFYSKKITNNFLRIELTLLKSQKVEAFKQLTLETYRANARGWGSFEDEMIGLKNAFANAKNAPFLRLDSKLKTPICVVGSGPSLESNIDFIRANQEKMLIFSCGTALKVLKAHNIIIDFQIEIERVPYLSEVLQSSNLGKTATLCASLVNPKVLEISQDSTLFMRGGSAASYIFDKIATQITPLEFCAPFVGNAGFSLACAMSEEIIMCGMDCGFVRGFAKHASGSIYGDERTEIPLDCFKVEGNRDDFEVFSNAIFSLSKESFALAIAHYKPKSVHNLSFGAKIMGTVFTPNLTLKSRTTKENLNSSKFFIDKSMIDLAKNALQNSALKFIDELTNALNCEISTKQELFVFIDKMSEFLAKISEKNPKVGILFEGSVCHLLQSAMIALLSIKSNDIKTPFCACKEVILCAVADFEAQIKDL